MMELTLNGLGDFSSFCELKEEVFWSMYEVLNEK